MTVSSPPLHDAQWTDSPPDPTRYSRFEAITGLFAQDSDDTNDDTFPLAPPHLGLVDGGDGRWTRFHAEVTKVQKKYEGTATVKFIIFCRHGQGFHNAAELKYGTIRWDDYYSRLPEFFDPHLTDLGKQQLVDVRNLLATEITAGMPFPFVISSPHMRTLETTTEEWLSVDDKLPTPIKVRPVVVDEFRETYGEHTCDSRRSTTELIPTWPRFDFTPVKVPDDVVWSPNWRETPDHVLERVRLGMAWIFANVHSDYVSVVAHSGIMTEAMRLTGHRPFKLLPGAIMPLVIVAHHANKTS